MRGMIILSGLALAIANRSDAQTRSVRIDASTTLAWQSSITPSLDGGLAIGGSVGALVSLHRVLALRAGIGTTLSHHAAVADAACPPQGSCPSFAYPSAMHRAELGLALEPTGSGGPLRLGVGMVYAWAPDLGAEDESSTGLQARLDYQPATSWRVRPSIGFMATRFGTPLGVVRWIVGPTLGVTF